MAKKARKSQQNSRSGRRIGNNNYYAHLEDEAENARLKKERKKKKKKGGKAGTRMYDDFAFRQALEADGNRTVNEVAADGNCLFRSLSDQLYLDYGQKHVEVRNDVCDFLEANEKEFSNFLILDEEEEDEDASSFAEYVELMREEGEWGGNVELVIAARLYRRNITVFSAVGAFSIESGHDKVSGRDLLLSYHENDHYNSVRDENSHKDQYNLPRADWSYETSPTASLKKKMVAAVSEGRPRVGVYDADGTGGGKSAGKGGGKEQRPQKRNDLCACGSGLRYKKCCLEREKSQIRAAKWKERNGIGSGLEEGEKLEEAKVLEGEFRVLKI